MQDSVSPPQAGARKAHNEQWRKANPDLATLADAFLLRLSDLLAPPLPPVAAKQREALVTGTVNRESPDETESGKEQN
jgi:hypothetical protein